MSLHRILMAGAGGQGILFIGKLLANAAMRQYPHVTFIPSYGAEVRGGPSSCQVIVSDTEIPSPVAERFEALILMNHDSVTRLFPLRDRAGLAIVNGSLSTVEPQPGLLRVPATEQAEELGDARNANLILLGALLKARPIVPPRDVEATLQRMLANKSAVLELNLAAFRAGLAVQAES